MLVIKRMLNLIPFRTIATAQFRRMLDWQLLRGSHEFPGPDGGTCINEAAIVAAGYAYRTVHSIDDCPASFSRPIAMFALCLNDLLEDTPRQRLLIPFVARLAGTADAPPVELARAELMLRRTTTDILAPALARAGFGELSRECRGLATPAQLVEVASLLRSQAGSGVHLLLIAACDSAADAARQYQNGRASEMVRCLAHVVGDIATVMGDGVAGSARDRAILKVFKRATVILEAMLEIGNGAERSVDIVAYRLDCAKRAPAKRQQGRKPLLVSNAL